MINKELAPRTEAFRRLPGFPSKCRLEAGMVAILECEQEIPCNPCETACPNKAITVGSPITNLPALHGELCVGCGLCVAGCPGQAIFMVDLTYGENTALAGFPYEYLPLPETEETVEVVGRNGEILGKGIVRRILSNKNTDMTNVIYVEVAKEIGEEVRSIVRK